MSVVRFKFRCNILISGKIIKEMLGSVASGTHCIKDELDATITNFIDNYNQLNMFRVIISPILRSCSIAGALYHKL